MSNSARERFLGICRFERPGDLCLLTPYFNNFWDETRKEWVKQGAPNGREGHDGDITIRSTPIGMYLYAKVNGTWYGTPLVKVPGAVKVPEPVKA